MSYGERYVAFSKRMSAPSLEWLDRPDLDPELFEARVATLADASDDGVQHRIGGYPSEIQDECMRLSCEHLARGLPARDFAEPTQQALDRASRQWRMLLQIDSDPDLGMNLGDGGRLYVFVRAQQARKGDFSKTVALSQTY